ncbi:MAG: macro domain-containing protein [Prosthecobacter sp.]
MNILLCYQDGPLGDAWLHAFKDLPDVRVVCDDICEVASDAIVSPANSFGFMDGGLDRLLSERFGWDLEKHVKQRIQERPMKELLVGEALVVPTQDDRVPWLICAPTMRVPMRIRTSVNAYLAMKALLLAAKAHAETPAIGTIAVPGLGTGVGELSPEIAAMQMAQAYREVVLNEFTTPDTFVKAQQQQLRLNRTSLLYD